MFIDRIPEPFQFNPLKHHLNYIRGMISGKEYNSADRELVRLMKHIGTSVMDIYSGQLEIPDILNEIHLFLNTGNLLDHDTFSEWAGTGFSDFRVAVLSDSSQWIMKYHNGRERFVHVFPARSSPHTFRVKANTLKSAILYLVVSGKDFISENEVNNARALAGLSPVKDMAETEAISEMIEILRS